VYLRGSLFSNNVLSQKSDVKKYNFYLIQSPNGVVDSLSVNAETIHKYLKC